ncbi:hypothetical protein MUK42_36077 [Musa troglodytarum]|uniref:Uncharacterized protein n=1 Tax=Musa troglodytarum TaxID=320322 RepID=A0A9E7H464_9LILI|nr:hypothetical protein MUK42_36077 [Musa troglodytarum]
MLCFEHSFLLPPSKARHYQISTANEGEKPKHEEHNVNQPSYTEVCTMELMETPICSALISKLVPISVYGSSPQLYNLQAIIRVDVKRLPPRDGMEMAPQGEGAKKTQSLPRAPSLSSSSLWFGAEEHPSPVTVFRRCHFALDRLRRNGLLRVRSLRSSY